MLDVMDGRTKNFSITISPGGRFHLMLLYDVLSPQPSLDASQIQQKKFRLAMSVGKNRPSRSQISCRDTLWRPPGLTP